ncbi:hypothetical protein T484DRAFT_1948548 [Baffinella frigidus]|nr:hypothetical protein T484DRAFT_1948548 [Cryptophyta sp. CCMP2293]
MFSRVTYPESYITEYTTYTKIDRYQNCPPPANSPQAPAGAEFYPLPSNLSGISP